MTIKDVYELGIELGVKNDLRGVAKVRKNLKRVQDQYEKLDSKQKKEFDKQRLENPYLDSQVLFDPSSLKELRRTGSEKEVKKVLAGVDIDTSELLLAKELGDIDLVIAHHPIGKGLSHLHDVMHLQAEVLADYGVPINVAQGLLKVRIDEVARGVNPANHYKTPMAAEILKQGLINMHTPCDNLVATFLKKKLNRKFEYVSEVLEVLNEIPEYAIAKKQGVGPRLFAGSPENYCGRIAITEITGGTEGSPMIYEKMAMAGIGTIIGMHMSEEHKKEAEKNHINAIIAGHISSDSIGMNLYLDELEKKGVEVVGNSGLIRVKRVK
jgi:putative NIF3 family GTP cyclohydrolase 1 type 2